MRGGDRPGPHRGHVPPAASHRRGPDVGAPRASATSWGWLVLACPLAGMLVVGLGWRSLPGRTAGWIASGAIFGSFLASVGMFANLLGRSPDHRSLVDSAFAYVHTAGVNADVSILVDPLSVFMCLVVSGV